MNGYDVATTWIDFNEVDDRDDLMAFFKSHGFNFDPKLDPWCAVFVNSCEREAGNKGTGLENAKSFLGYGTVIKDIMDARHGDILIFQRGGAGSWLGHVTYFDSINADGSLRCLGGNQHDSVCYANYSSDALLGIRRP